MSNENDLRTLLSSSRGEQGWRTMDSAPKDGTHIIGNTQWGAREIWWHKDTYEGEYWTDEGDSEPEPTGWIPMPGSVPTSLAGQHQMRPHGGIAACYDCNRPYGDEFGFPDLVLPNDVWSAISPTKNEGGLLCPSCICKRLHSAGIETHGVFRSGPLSETSLAGHKILEGLRDAVAGDLPRVTIEGVTYVRQDAGSPEALLAASRQTIIDLQTELDVLKAASLAGQVPETAKRLVELAEHCAEGRIDGNAKDISHHPPGCPCESHLLERMQSSPQPTAGGDAPAGVWPDFIAPPQYENPCEGWSDPALPPFRTIWEVARSCGYAVGLHGSMKRDVDLIAAPWVENADASEQLINSLCDALNARMVGPIESKPLGRLAATIQIDAYVKPIDISVMPKDALSAERARVIAQAEAAIRTVIDPIAADPDSAFRNGAIAALAALRALGQQGGAQ